MAATDDAPGLIGPNILIDTDILIDAARNSSHAAAFLTALQAQAPLRISAISAMELVSGCRNKQELEELRRFLAPLDVVPVSEAVSDAALELMKSFWLSHGLLLADALIGATAREHGLMLFTKNTRHFQMIPELIVNRPY